ncbi:glycosyltransferase [Aureimonas psammosilenae]|uniref:glycosyltransferase n=1 Tax=Aureimonas psammosilenae TaxID=2495496 RepID=UPI00186A964C|nr:glycosyltransferase [Aureimonas psammosilenae]
MAVAISVYRPDMVLLERLLARVSGAGAPIHLHIDGPVGEAIGAEDLARLQGDTALHVTQSPRNEGIAAVLNRLADAAKGQNCAFVLYFDQDSEPDSDLASRLLAAFRAIEAKGARPAAIGPLPVAHDPLHSKAPRYRCREMPGAEGGVPVDYLITSGSLISLVALAAIGPFEERYRIDAVDVEWCFRAWSRGFSVWLLEEAEMPHRVGSGVVRVGPIAFPSQNPSRMGTYMRNQFHMLRLSHVPARWKLRTLAYVPLQGLVYAAKRPGERWRTAWTLGRAAWEGLRLR